jgi:hypothetical protein
MPPAPPPPPDIVPPPPPPATISASTVTLADGVHDPLFVQTIAVKFVAFSV